MSDDDYKGLANILRITPAKKKVSVVTREEEKFEDALEEYFVPSKDENLWPSLRYQNEKKNK